MKDLGLNISQRLSVSMKCTTYRKGKFILRSHNTT